MKIITNKTEHRDFIEIFPYENGYALITISRNKKPLWDNDPTAKEPKINWASIGEVGIKNAKLFNAGLNTAIKIARNLKKNE